MPSKILITKPEKNALTATSLNDFYMHSDYPLLKVHASGTFATLINGEKTIMHNLGYKPFAIVFSQFVDTNGIGSPIVSAQYFQHDWLIEGASHEFFGRTKIYNDRLEIEVGNTDTVNPGIINGIYYIFKDEI